MTTYKIGILHSLSGAMAGSEKPLVDASLLAIDEINSKGGVLGRLIEPIIEDGASDSVVFQQKAKKLIQKDKITTIFGCWTSFARKAIKPTIEKSNSLLWYPVQYEGLESSKNIIYTGSCLNQQIYPAVRWLIKNHKKSFFLLGSDYVFPRTANKFIKAQLKQENCQVAGEEYIPLAANDFTEIISQIKKVQPDVIFNTLNGDSNFSFYKQYHKAGISHKEIPIMAVSIAEEELQKIGSTAEGHFACWSYFQSLDTPENKRFVSNFKDKYGSNRVTSDPIEAAYSQLFLWKQTVETSNFFNVPELRKNIIGQCFNSPGGQIRIESNNHVMKNAHIGKISPNGQFEIVWSSEKQIKPLPWLGLEEANLPNSKLVIDLLSEVSEGIQYSWLLEQNTLALEKTNIRLKEEISNRLKVESILREKEERYRSITQTARDAIISADGDGNIISWNKGAQIIFGYRKEEVLGKPITILMPKEYRAAHNKGLKQVAATGKLSLAGKTIELHGLRKNNSEFPLELSLGSWKSGEEIFYSGILRDITERNQVEAELAEKRQNLERTVDQRTKELRESLKKVEDTNIRLEQANQAKARFLSSMSHELRTPLNGILGFTDLLQGQFFGNLNEKQLEYITQIDDSGKHLLSLINDLLDITKIDAGAMEFEMNEISPEEFINAATAMMNSQFKKKHISVKSTIDPTISVVTADIRKCKQILLNLLSNALKYTPEGGEVEIRVAKEGDSFVRIEVSDNGIGIQPNDIDKIFSEFHQADHVRDEQLGGTGIGLALTRRLVEIHKGDIGVKSESGKGSIFWFTLPMKKGSDKAPDKPGKEHKAEGPAPSTSRRILVAEDNKINLKMIIDMLSIQNHEVMVAKNGQEAIELAQSFKPELILMDMRMPVMSGIEATNRLRAMPEFADTPIIALTASTGTEAEERQVTAGCTAHLAKPIQTKELFETLKKHLK